MIHRAISVMPPEEQEIEKPDPFFVLESMQEYALQRKNS